MQGDGVAPRVAAEELGRPGVGAQQTEEHTDGRRLAGAVRPEEAVDLAGFDLQVEAVQGARVTEGLDELGDGDRGHARDRTKVCRDLLEEAAGELGGTCLVQPGDELAGDRRDRLAPRLDEAPVVTEARCGS